MLRELMRYGIDADFVVGSSVGALNAAYFASAPNAAGVDKLGQIWSNLRRRDVFPVTLRSLLRFAGGEGHLIDPSNLRLLIKRHIPFSKSGGLLHSRTRHRHESGRRCNMSLIGFRDRQDIGQRRHSRLRSRRFASTINISLMARSEATRLSSRRPSWAPPTSSFSRRDMHATFRSPRQGQSRELYMRLHYSSRIKLCVT